MTEQSNAERVRQFRARQRTTNPKEPNWRDIEGRLGVVAIWLRLGKTVPKSFTKAVRTIITHLKQEEEKNMGGAKNNSPNSPKAPQPQVSSAPVATSSVPIPPDYPTTTGMGYTKFYVFLQGHPPSMEYTFTEPVSPGIADTYFQQLYGRTYLYCRPGYGRPVNPTQDSFLR